jgi:glycosyltransferase involved in cell wall biosynthesis
MKCRMPQGSPAILFFVPEWPALVSPILHAQVLSVAAFLNQQGLSCSFAGAETSPARAREAAAMIEREYSVRAHIYPTLTSASGAWTCWNSCRKTYTYLARAHMETAFSHVYARSFIGSMWARKLARRIKAISVFDVRAIISQEQQIEGKASLKSWISSQLELRESRRADRLSTVSENLRAYLENETSRDNIVVIPSCFNEHSFYFDPEARKGIRAALGLTEQSVLLCYSGGTSAWQRIDDIISLFKRVCSADRRCRVLILTTSQEEVTRRIREAQFPNGQATVQGCHHKEVHRYLSAADIGFIMRHDTTVNNVASPVKVGEYLACGLPVVLTRGIGDYSEILPMVGVGLLLDETTDIAAQVLQFIGQANFVDLRDQAIRFAQSRLTMSANRGQYHSLYDGTWPDRPSQC